MANAPPMEATSAGINMAKNGVIGIFRDLFWNGLRIIGYFSIAYLDITTN